MGTRGGTSQTEHKCCSFTVSMVSWIPHKTSITFHGKIFWIQNKITRNTLDMTWCQILCTMRGCFGRPKLGECDKMGSVSKIMSRWKKQIRPQFSEYRLQIESAWAHRLWAHADSFWKRYFENCGRIYFFLRLILVVFFLENRVNFSCP